MGRGPRGEAVAGLAHGLRALRLRAGLSQEELAARVRAGGAGLSRTYYQQIESGRRFPSPRLRAAILAAMGADDAALCAASGPAPAPPTRFSAPVGRAAPAPPVDRVPPPRSTGERDLDDLLAAARALGPQDRRLLRDLARRLRAGAGG
jgi:transcriptional regulator with XRE-family HTH domain